jgi:hypothetical protein
MFRLSQYYCDAGENIAGNQKAKVMEEAIGQGWKNIN